MPNPRPELLSRLQRAVQSSQLALRAGQLRLSTIPGGTGTRCSTNRNLFAASKQSFSASENSSAPQLRPRVACSCSSNSSHAAAALTHRLHIEQRHALMRACWAVGACISAPSRAGVQPGQMQGGDAAAAAARAFPAACTCSYAQLLQCTGRGQAACRVAALCSRAPGGHGACPVAVARAPRRAGWRRAGARGRCL